MKAGIDEVGTGAVAGPVVVAIVVIEQGAVPGLRDSKLIAEAKRYDLAWAIKRASPFLWTAQREVDFIDRHGLAKAWLACMQECVHYVMCHFQTIEIMADNPPAKWRLDGLQGVKFMPNGDDTVYEIQAASIVAKAHRDRVMQKLAQKHPGYGLETHKGYGTKQHIQVLKDKGPSPVHRSSWQTLIKNDKAKKLGGAKP
jgi:ribonuclease HII